MNVLPAIDRALREMPEGFEIKRYLEANREGVKKMLLTEYDEVKTMRQFKEEGRVEGRAEGRAEKEKEDARIIADTFNIPIEQVTAALREKSAQYSAQ